MKRIVVLGGGYSGVLTAKHLAKKYKAGGDVEITLIDKNPFHTMLTELHEVAADRVDEDSIKISLKRVFAGRHVNVGLDTITKIDYDQKHLTGLSGTYPYDYLVLASGSRPTFFGVPGAQEFSWTLWSYDDAVRLKDHILNVFRLASQEPDLEKRKKLLTFYVVGAGFTGVEMAGELAEWVPVLCQKFELDARHVTIVDVDILDRIVPVLPEKLSIKAHRRLERMGVKVLLRHGVVAIGEDYLECKQNDEIKRFDATTVIWTAGIEGSEIAQEVGKNLTVAGRGRIQTDAYLRAIRQKDVFVAGDNIFYIPEGEETPVPQMVENCEACAKTISRNIIRSIENKELESYKPKFHGVMVCLGGRYGVAHVGAGRFWLRLPSFFAMFTKHFINLIYFVEVLGWNKIYSYLYHEFFTIRHNRSFVGGHFSNKTPNFWLVPFRLWLGFYWIYEGVMKIREGWFKEAHLSSFLGLDATSGATGATSGATAAAAETFPELLNFGLGDFLRFILYGGEQIAFKVQLSPIDWMLNKMFAGHEGVQMAFQYIVVSLEILIGLALIGGLFTFLAATCSIVLQLMFLTSTGIYMASCWMLFGAVAVLVGGGSVLGLDYYVLPVLKEWWKNTRLGGKWYLYND